MGSDKSTARNDAVEVFGGLFRKPARSNAAGPKVKTTPQTGGADGRAAIGKKILHQPGKEAHEAFSYLASVSIPTLFFKIGLLIVLFEHAFEVYYHALAFTPFSTRAFIGVHLWPSQVWFIMLGTVVAAGDLFKNRFRVPRRVLSNSIPIFAVLGVYFSWSIYGFIVGNSGAMALFREMVFAGFSFPALLYLSKYVKVRDLFDTFIKASLILFPVIVINTVVYKFIPFLPGAQNGLLLLSSFVYSYFLYKAIRSNFYIIPAIMVILPILMYFNKPMIVLILFLPAAIAVISTAITKKIRKYSINRRTLKILGIIVLIVFALIAWEIGRAHV